MGTPYLGEVRIFSFNFPPKGWAFCNGQTLAIAQNQALFALLGTTYGGNGVTTFALPNLQGRVLIGFGYLFTQGQSGGEEAHTIIQSEFPAHMHAAIGSSNPVDQGSPQNNYWAVEESNAYAAAFDSTMVPSAVTTVGGS